jgi:aminoglycoside phosphotransferase (APT) family kinase protein
MVTSYVDGEPLSFFGQTTAADDARLPAYFATVAAIHSIDWRAMGLAFLDTADDGVEAELRRDEARLRHHSRYGPDERRFAGWLRANKPAKTYKTLLHGDPNPANYLFDGTRIAAVLDWELALIGDPRLDLGFFAAIQSVLGGDWKLDARAHARGYAMARPDGDLRRLEYFEAAGLFRLTGFLHAGERLHGADVSALRDRLHGRFEGIASGNAGDLLAPASRHRGSD